MDANPEVITIAGSDVYVGGDFTFADGFNLVNHIARWDGTSWHALGDGVNNYVCDIAVAGADVYVGGAFTNAGPGFTPISSPAGMASQWHSLGSGICWSVNAIAVAGANVYVGGSTTSIAQWDGTKWYLIDGLSNSSSCREIVVAGADVFVGGTFTDAGGVPDTAYIARLDSDELHPIWNELRGALNSYVKAIAVVGSNVYVGGNFTDVGGIPNIDYIARWDGDSWNSLGGITTLNGAVYAIAVAGANVYVGGNFTNAGGVIMADYIARWDGSAWHSLGA